MNIIKKLLSFLQTREDIVARARERREELYAHVHLSPRINDDYSTDTFVCIDIVRIARVMKSDDDEKGIEPKVGKAEVEDLMKYLRVQYYKNHKKEIIV